MQTSGSESSEPISALGTNSFVDIHKTTVELKLDAQNQYNCNTRSTPNLTRLFQANEELLIVITPSRYFFIQYQFPGKSFYYISSCLLCGSIKVALSNGRPVPAVLLANKCDQQHHSLCPRLPKLENFSKEYGFAGWYETSAKVRDHFVLCFFKLTICNANIVSSGDLCLSQLLSSALIYSISKCHCMFSQCIAN